MSHEFAPSTWAIFKLMEIMSKVRMEADREESDKEPDKWRICSTSSSGGSGSWARHTCWWWYSLLWSGV